jgi:hypothetical protein
MSINWQALLAEYWPHIVAVIGAVLGWNNRKEIMPFLGMVPDNDGEWPSGKAAPSGTADFVSVIRDRMKGVPEEKILDLLAKPDATPDMASQLAVVHFRGEVKS